MRLLRRFRIALGVPACAGAAAACGPRVPTSDSPAAVVLLDSGTVAVDGTHLYYEAAGRGPAVVLLHGGNLDRRMWDAQFLPLAREHRVIRYDFRGYGRSGPADTPFRAYEELRAPTLLVIGTRDTPDIQAIADTLGATVPGMRHMQSAACTASNAARTRERARGSPACRTPRARPRRSQLHDLVSRLRAEPPPSPRPARLRTSCQPPSVRTSD